MINKKHIGSRIFIKKHNLNVLIEDNPEKYDYYKSIGLERIFKKEKKKVDDTDTKSTGE